MKYEHKGYEITFAENNGSFFAVINGKNVKASSLSAIKKKIDTFQAEAFQPFKSLDVGDYGHEVREGQVVAVVKGRTKYSSQVFEVMYGNRRTTQRALIRDTPENRAMAVAHAELCSVAREQVRELLEKIEASRRALPWINPEDNPA